MDECSRQHADNVQQMFASLAAMMREQQQFMAQTTELQRQMAATLQQQQQQQATVSQQQLQPSDSTAHDTREYGSTCSSSRPGLGRVSGVVTVGGFFPQTHTIKPGLIAYRFFVQPGCT
ncbi:hypothetical protein PI124_g23618 [Phytophthora idaei]|nr:hypothetical protein PI125_g26151 [Phytophthora idaei]KAG3123028.1 hypothetical protein PI126_g23886 [Phytophthora idaei]KAG3231287.1 hypothetical protein PI124_g23618 [Phytophthora idaei]